MTLAWGGPNGAWLAAGYDSGHVRVWRWDAATATATVQADMASHDGPVLALAFHPHRDTLVSGGHDRVLVLCDPGSGQERTRLPGHTDRILRLQFVPAGLLSVARNGEVKLWPASAPPQP